MIIVIGEHVCVPINHQLPDGAGGKGMASSSFQPFQRRLQVLEHRNCSMDAHRTELKLLKCIEVSVEFLSLKFRVVVGEEYLPPPFLIPLLPPFLTSP